MVCHHNTSSDNMSQECDLDKKEVGQVQVHAAIENEEYQEYLALKDVFQGERLAKLTVRLHAVGADPSARSTGTSFRSSSPSTSWRTLTERTLRMPDSTVPSWTSA
jgi:hypothetical protein